MPQSLLVAKALSFGLPVLTLAAAGFLLHRSSRREKIFALILGGFSSMLSILWLRTSLINWFQPGAATEKFYQVTFICGPYYAVALSILVGIGFFLSRKKKSGAAEIGKVKKR